MWIASNEVSYLTEKSYSSLGTVKHLGISLVGMTEVCFFSFSLHFCVDQRVSP